jgi:hypothetical protein
LQGCAYQRQGETEDATFEAAAVETGDGSGLRGWRTELRWCSVLLAAAALCARKRGGDWCKEAGALLLLLYREEGKGHDRTVELWRWR